MSTLNLAINKISFPGNGTIPSQITATFYIRPYYPANGGYTLLATGVLIDVDGTVLASPPPIAVIDPSQQYMLKVVNEVCDSYYEQAVAIYPHCPIGYALSADGTYCFYQLTTSPTPPSNSENTVAETYFTYSCWGTLIYNPGYGVNGVGSFTQIPTSNTFWINGTGYPATGDTSHGPMNRTALWATTTTDDQTIGFSVCLDIPTNATYLVAIAGDNVPQISVDGNIIVAMDPTALGTYLAANGFPGILPYADEAAFRFWNVYPVYLAAGTRVVQMTCFNTTGPAAMAAEIYNCDAATLAAATSYLTLGSALIFSTLNYIGQPVQIGSGGIGYQCPDGYVLNPCGSPPTCIERFTAPIEY
jgi:hypothetical protein